MGLARLLAYRAGCYAGATSLVLALKCAYYRDRGEPFRVAGQTLRFVPGTRPTRLKYASSVNLVNRYDALQTKWLTEHLAAGATAFDVGGRDGSVALVMAACVGASGRVVTFEPDPAGRKVIERNVRLNSGLEDTVAVEPFAVSDRAGEADFFTDAANSSLQRWSTAHPSSAAALKVRLITLDDYVGDAAPPSVVKIDIEGAEIGALRGPRRLLAGVTDFLVELQPYAWSAFGDSFGEMQQLVASTGAHALPRSNRCARRRSSLRHGYPRAALDTPPQAASRTETAPASGRG